VTKNLNMFSKLDIYDWIMKEIGEEGKYSLLFEDLKMMVGGKCLFFLMHSEGVWQEIRSWTG
jgi:hypothetical protein